MKKRWAAVLAVVLLCVAAMALGEGTVSALYERRTLHGGYDPDRMPDEEVLQLILDAAFSMPTGGGQRSLNYYVVSSRTVMQAMRGGNPYSEGLETAPVVIVVAADNAVAAYEELQEMDAGLAAGAMLIQASALGLTTCVLSIAPQQTRMEAVRGALSLQGSMDPILMVALGYPERDGISGASVRTSQDGRVHFVEGE